MNHSEAAQIRYVAKLSLTYLYATIAEVRKEAARYWEMARPGFRTGEHAFERLNECRNRLRELHRERRAWESLVRLLKDEIRNEQIFNSLNGCDAIEAITDADYGTLDNGIEEWEHEEMRQMQAIEDGTAWHLNNRGW